MCGIAGIYFQRERSADALINRAQRMAAALRHRGPDDSGYWVDPKIGLALVHTRLAIIDPSEHGHQPMVSRDRRWKISFNGEIYNHICLRRELRKANILLTGHSDTETALEYIAHFGLSKALDRFNGMFAIALWDKDSRNLHLIRDRVGIKPLYYGHVNRAWIFASELKAFSEIPERPQQIDSDALGVFMRHGYLTDDTCIFDGMYKVPPGAIVTIPIEESNVSTSYFWSLRGVLEQPSRQASILKKEEAEKLLHQKLDTAVKKRMIADVSVGAFLSGGVDSSLVVALMQKNSTMPVRTFSIGFKEKNFDESIFAKEVSNRLGTNHTQLIVGAEDALGLIGELPKIYDEPFADSSQIPTIMVSKLAAEHVKVVLSGDGGDEIFGGYSRYKQVDNLWRRICIVPAFIGGPLSTLLRSLSHPSEIQSKKLRLSNMLNADSATDFYRAAISMVHDVTRIVPGAKKTSCRFDEAGNIDRLRTIEEQMMYTDFVTYLPGDILTKVDRASMSSSLEARVPLLDHEVIQAAWSVPLEVRGNVHDPKLSLRNILFRYLDRSLFDRPKAGFSAPIAQWLRGPLRDWAESLMAAESSNEHLNIRQLNDTWAAFIAGQDNQVNVLWNAMIFLSWHAVWCSD